MVNLDILLVVAMGLSFVYIIYNGFKLDEDEDEVKEYVYYCPELDELIIRPYATRMTSRDRIINANSVIYHYIGEL